MNEDDFPTEFSKAPSFQSTSKNQLILEFAMALGSFKDGEFSPGGVGTIIGSNLLITAKHVVLEDWKRFESQQPLAEVRKYEGTFSMHGVQTLERGQKVAIWNVRRIFLSNHTDVAFLYITPFMGVPKNYQWRRVAMELGPPAVGSRLSAFGYRRAKINQSGKKITWEIEPMTSIGEVLDVYRDRRDSMLPFPCFSTTAPWENQMSGGPIFNESGRICGLIATSSWMKEEHRYSIGTTLWPSMATLFDLKRQGSPGGGRYPAIDLAKDGFILAHGWEQITFTKIDEQTLQIGWRESMHNPAEVIRTIVS